MKVKLTHYGSDVYPNRPQRLTTPPGIPLISEEVYVTDAVGARQIALKKVHEPEFRRTLVKELVKHYQVAVPVQLEQHMVLESPILVKVYARQNRRFRQIESISDIVQRETELDGYPESVHVAVQVLYGGLCGLPQTGLLDLIVLLHHRFAGYREKVPNLLTLDGTISLVGKCEVFLRLTLDNRHRDGDGWYYDTGRSQICFGPLPTGFKGTIQAQALNLFYRRRGEAENRGSVPNAGREHEQAVRESGPRHEAVGDRTSTVSHPAPQPNAESSDNLSSVANFEVERGSTNGCPLPLRKRLPPSAADPGHSSSPRGSLRQTQPHEEGRSATESTVETRTAGRRYEVRVFERTGMPDAPERVLGELPTEDPRGPVPENSASAASGRSVSARSSGACGNSASLSTECPSATVCTARTNGATCSNGEASRQPVRQPRTSDLGLSATGMEPGSESNTACTARMAEGSRADSNDNACGNELVSHSIADTSSTDGRAGSDHEPSCRSRASSCSSYDTACSAEPTSSPPTAATGAGASSASGHSDGADFRPTSTELPGPESPDLSSRKRSWERAASNEPGPAIDIMDFECSHPTVGSDPLSPTSTSKRPVATVQPQPRMASSDANNASSASLQTPRSATPWPSPSRTEPSLTANSNWPNGSSFFVNDEFDWNERLDEWGSSSGVTMPVNNPSRAEPVASSLSEAISDLSNDLDELHALIEGLGQPSLQPSAPTVDGNERQEPSSESAHEPTAQTTEPDLRLPNTGPTTSDGRSSELRDESGGAENRRTANGAANSRWRTGPIASSENVGTGAASLERNDDDTGDRRRSAPSDTATSAAPSSSAAPGRTGDDDASLSVGDSFCIPIARPQQVGNSDQETVGTYRRASEQELTFHIESLRQAREPSLRYRLSRFERCMRSQPNIAYPQFAKDPFYQCLSPENKDVQEASIFYSYLRPCSLNSLRETMDDDAFTAALQGAAAIYKIRVTRGQTPVFHKWWRKRVIPLTQTLIKIFWTVASRTEDHDEVNAYSSDWFRGEPMLPRVPYATSAAPEQPESDPEYDSDLEEGEIRDDQDHPGHYDHANEDADP